MREMKDSGVKWIGEIPEDWKISKVKYHVENLDGKRVPIDSALRVNGIYPYWGAGSITDYVDDYLFDEELILLGEDGAPFFDPYRPVAFLVNEKIWVNNHIHVLRPKSSINALFVTYFLNIVDYGTYINGTILNKLTQSNLKKIAIVYPSLEKQEKIVHYLDDKCSGIDFIISKQKQIVEKLNVYKIALITETVTRGVHPCRNTKKTNIGWISEIPSHWTEYRVANLYDQTNESGDESLPILTVSINSGISDRELKDDEQERVFVRSEDRTKYKRVRPGDLVYNMMRAWQGAFGAVRVNGMVSPAYITCRPKKNTEIDSRYIEYLFRTPIAVEEMHRYSHGIADFRLRLYWPEFKNIRLCIPPIQEQTEIADYIDEKCLLIDKLIEKRECLIKKIEGYKKSLIYECVTGKKEISVHIKDAYDTGIKPKVLEQICDQAKSCGIHKVILFGSRARGTFHRDSDIDLAVCGGNVDLFRLAVEEETDTLLAYDVVNLDRTSNEELLDVIRKEGVIIYEEV